MEHVPMRKLTFAVLLVSLYLPGCSAWDDFIDTITGSDDDPPKANTATTNTTTTTDSSSSTNTSTTTSGTSTTTTSSSTNKVSGTYAGRTNPDRPTWRWDRRMDSFPSTFKLVFEGCYTVTVANNGTRWESGATVVKQSDGYPGMAALAESSCYSTTAYVEY